MLQIITFTRGITNQLFNRKWCANLRWIDWPSTPRRYYDSCQCTFEQLESKTRRYKMLIYIYLNLILLYTFMLFFSSYSRLLYFVIIFYSKLYIHLNYFKYYIYIFYAKYYIIIWFYIFLLYKEIVIEAYNYYCDLETISMKL